MEMIGAIVGLSIATWILIAIVAALLLPALWLWMFIDAIVREEADYPSHDFAEKIAWIVLMVVVQPVAALYFVLVWLPVRRRRNAAQAGLATGPAAGTGAGASGATAPTCC